VHAFLCKIEKLLQNASRGTCEDRSCLQNWSQIASKLLVLRAGRISEPFAGRTGQL